MYPRVIINADHLKHNIDFLNKKLDTIDDVYIVTKSFCANEALIEKMNEWGYYKFADSRIQNLKKIKNVNPHNKTLQLRLPQLNEVSEVIKYADCSLNSEIETIKALNEECAKIKASHEIFLMIDVGDLREGIMYDGNYLDVVKQIMELPYIRLKGIGVNVTCYGSVIPTKETFELLINIQNEINEKFSLDLKEMSGGNSSSIYYHLDEGGLPEEITNLRIGDAFLRGYETSYSKEIKGMHHDVFTLEAQIIELKDKPSHPIGKLGVNAFGEEVEYEDVGNHVRAILAVGVQDVNPEKVTPIDQNIRIIGASSDHFIVEVNSEDYKLGSTVSFEMDYGAILSLCTSEYVKKVIK